MAVVTTCDHCGQPIGEMNDRVDVRVQDHYIPRIAYNTKGKLIRPIPEAPERLTLSLDLHRECYIEHYLPAFKLAKHVQPWDQEVT